MISESLMETNSGFKQTTPCWHPSISNIGDQELENHGLDLTQAPRKASLEHGRKKINCAVWKHQAGWHTAG